MPKAPSLEERIRSLEAFRYAMLGRVNACQDLLFDLWLNTFDQFKDPVAALEKMRVDKLRIAASTHRPFPGVDPAELDMVHDEYVKSLDQLLSEMVRLRKAGPKVAGHKPPKPGRSE